MRRLLLLSTVLFTFSCAHSVHTLTAPKTETRRKPTAEEKGFVSIYDLDPNKQTVCAMTLNSSNEIESFQEHLSSEHFQFVELVTSDEHWLTQAARAKIKCDILVISGHFAGTFFGTNGKIPLEELENQICSNSASGIFHAPKEVFLFGCNTLAGKEKDSRSPEVYRQVLLEHGYSQDVASEIAAVRYSPVGEKFSDRMSRIFAGVPRIYGFNSIGPSGKNVEPMLRQYFDKNPDYFNYLKTIDKTDNRTFLNALKYTAVAQIAGDDVTQDHFVPRCFMADKNVPDSKKIDWIFQTLKNVQNSRLANLSLISDYLLKRSQSGPGRFADEKKLSEIANDKALATDMSTLLNSGLSEFPVTRMNLVAIGQYFGWFPIGADKALLSPYFADGKITKEEKEQICAFDRTTRKNVDYDMVKSVARGPDFYDALACLQSADPQIHRTLLEEVLKLVKVPSYKLPEENQIAFRKALNALAEGHSSDPKIHQSLADMIVKGDYSIRRPALEALGKMRLLNSQVLKIIVETAQGRHGSEFIVKVSAINALGSLRPSEPQTHLELMNLLSDQKLQLYAAQALRRINSADPQIHRALSRVVAGEFSSIEGAKAQREAASALLLANSHDPDVLERIAKVLNDDLAENPTKLICYQILKASNSQILSVLKALDGNALWAEALL